MEKFKVYVNGGIIYPSIKKFPGGEVLVNCLIRPTDYCRIEAILISSDDVMSLIMLTDCLRKQGVEKIRLTMPYVPYARQDRVCNAGESLSIQAFAKLVNSLEFSSVVIYDPHSDVTPALIDRCIVTPRWTLMQAQQDLFGWILHEEAAGTPLYLVSPDAGSVKKSYEIAKNFPQFRGIIFADKVRDVATGSILRTSVNNIPVDIRDAKLLVCDDICDGGRTFIELGKVLAEYQPKEMNLYVTHGIFSQGKHVLLKNIKTAEECLTPDPEGANLNSGVFDNVWCSVDFTKYKRI